MSRTFGIIQVRPGDQCLRDKLSRKLGGRSLLEVVVRRVTECQQLDGVAVVLGAGAEDAELADLVPPDVLLHVSDRPDMLGRFVSAAAAFGADAVVRVCAEHPFVDPFLIDRLATTAEAHPHCDYIGFCSQAGRPSMLAALESFGEWCRTDALRRADREATLPADREHVTRYICSHPELFPLRFITAPGELECEGQRLAWDGEEAWEHALTLHDALGHEHVNWRKLAGLLHGVPARGHEGAAILGKSVAPAAP